MEVEAPNASFLVISQTNYPGWHVSVNDEPAHLYQTNLAFQGVAVPPGRSRIVLEFWSASLSSAPASRFRLWCLPLLWFCGTGAAVCRGKDPTPEWMPDPSRLSLNSIRGKS